MFVICLSLMHARVFGGRTVCPTQSVLKASETKTVWYRTEEDHLYDVFNPYFIRHALAPRSVMINRDLC